jgi:predicted glycosyltransferase
VLLASGSDDIQRMNVPGGAEVLKLPALRKVANERYQSRYLMIPEHEVRALRARLLVGAVEAFKPDVLLVDKHPFGAGGELKVALAVHRDNGGKSALGLRDILDDPATVRREWEPHGLPDRIPDLYETVMVYGHQRIFDPIADYGFGKALERKTVFCGYVSDSAMPPVSEGSEGPRPSERLGIRLDAARPLVLATVGGGEDGFPLLKLFVQAAAGRAWNAVAVAGPMMPEHQVSVLKHLARTHGVQFHRFVPGLSSCFPKAGVIVCMGGYNTLAQTLASGASVLCVPRVVPRLEQSVRAEAFARRGLLRSVRLAGLRVAGFRAEIEAALAVPRAELGERIAGELEFAGAAHAADHLLQLARTARVARVSPVRVARSQRPPRSLSPMAAVSSTAPVVR